MAQIARDVISKMQMYNWNTELKNMADQIVKREEKVGDYAGEEVALEVEVAEVGGGGYIGRERAGEDVEAEAKGLEGGEVANGGGGQPAGEAHAGEAELRDAAGGAMDADPVAGGGFGEVPEEGAAADGRAESEERGAVSG
ncbi:hypothetical protein RJ639_028721 [Escallonia herrerae]|uniref:Uncharacterized protein n=1 Tax=Escallonia herrerae TaxID=1293975 RepID=A0AA88X3N5_9ASTE|nr:hypothetical protein RJ639_028721 [Escallonia herrerae]